MSLNDKYVKDPLIWPNTIEARLYQRTIAERAIQKNTMVILPTALGKTVITTLVAAHFLYNHWDLKVLLMAPTRPLILQHENTFRKFLRVLNDKIVVLTGNVPPDFRRALWEKDAKIFFATPQVVKNDLENGRVSLKNFGLLVFDECHRARKNYAYTFVAEKYVEQMDWPVILATTASPGSNPEVIQEICNNLNIEQIEFRTEENPDVAPYLHKIDVEWRQVDLPKEYKELGLLLRTILQDRLGKLRARMQYLGLISGRRQYATRRALLEAGEKLRQRLGQASEVEKGPLYGAIIIQSASLTVFHALELLETQGIYSLIQFLEKIEKNSGQKKSYGNVVKDPRYLLLHSTLIKMREKDHPKVLVLQDEVRRHLIDNPSKRILVFTQYRNTATHLVTQLKSLTGVVVERFVGQANKEDDPGLSQEKQAQILADFQEGKLNTLVSTSIAEEGLDIPAVDLVVFYEPIPSEIRYIQRKGRTGRKDIGKVVILATKGTSDIASLYASRRKVQKMKEIVTNLNQRLSSSPWRKRKPPFMAIPEFEIAKTKSLISSTKPQKAEDVHNKEALRDFTRDVNHTMTNVWIKVMKAGSNGLPMEEVFKTESLEGYSPRTVKAAISKLEKNGQIRRLDQSRIASIVSRSDRQTKGNDVVYSVEIEKILPQKAICIINNKWRAQLLPEDYEGPPQLIKKNLRFSARGTLYHLGATLYIRIRQVIAIL